MLPLLRSAGLGTDSQQGDGDLSPTAIRLRVLPTGNRLAPRASRRSAACQHLDFSPRRLCQTSDLQKCEVICKIMVICSSSREPVLPRCL